MHLSLVDFACVSTMLFIKPVLSESGQMEVVALLLYDIDCLYPAAPWALRWISWIKNSYALLFSCFSGRWVILSLRFLFSSGLQFFCLRLETTLSIVQAD